MSIDEEFDNNLSDVSLLKVLESRNECLNKSEVWAILKETCIALKQIEDDAKNRKYKLDINCLIIDGSGNIKVEFEHSNGKHGITDGGRDRECLINSLGEMFQYILLNYSNVKDSEDIFQFVEHMAISNSDEQFTFHNIELYSDRQLNGSSVDLLYHEYINSKRSDELSSAFQDSFLSSEFGNNNESDNDTDPSLCITKDFDTFSIVSDDETSVDNYEESKYFVCLNQLWSHSLDPIFRSDKECLVFIYVILKEMSNILLNEDNFDKCLCISKENVFLNPLGQMLLNFSSIHCVNCNPEHGSIKYHDSKYINTVGAIIYDITQSYQPAFLSDQVVLLLQRMTESTDMIINEILNFCKTNSSFQTIKCRSVLKCLFERWNLCFNIHLRYLLNLKHKYLYEISTKNLIESLRPTETKPSLTVLQLFQQNPSWLSGLRYATKLSKTRTFPPPPIIFPKFVRTNSISAFRPYNTPNQSIFHPPLPSTTRIKTNTHFRPLVLTSESNSVYRSQDILFSPVDILPKFTNTAQSKALMPAVVKLSSYKTSRYTNNLSLNDLPHECDLRSTASSSFRQKHSNTAVNKALVSMSFVNRTSKVNLIIDVIQAVLSKTFVIEDHELGDRHLLGVADFALSIGRLSKSIFLEAMKQRFSHISWPIGSLEELYDIISTKDIHTPLSDNKSSDVCSKDYFSVTNLNTLGTESNINKATESVKSRSSQSSNSESVNSECFEEIERECAAAVEKETCVIDVPTEPIIAPFVDTRERKQRDERLRKKSSLIVNKSSDINDNCRSKPVPILPNKLQSTFSFLSSEDTTFYQQIFPTTLLCFQSTLAYINQSTSGISDQIVNANKIQELLISFQDINRTIRYKFKELSKTIDLIAKCNDTNKNDKKLKKRFLIDHRELQLDLETLILNEMKLENTIVEYHSVSLETILEEIKSSAVKQSIIFSNDVRNFQNLQFIHPMCLVTFLFARGAVSSGLMYDFFLVYREFYSPSDFIDNLKTAFTNIEGKLRNGSLLVAKARFRLLYIILCWIDGFYHIDITPQILASIKDLARSNLVPFIKNTNHLLENAVTHSRSSKTVLSLQYTALNRRTVDIIQYVDIQKMISDIVKKEKDKDKSFLRSSAIFSRSNILGNQDTFSILNISPKDLAICLTLIQQTSFDPIHPCHLLLYVRSLSSNDESFLKSINNDRFPTRNSLTDDIFHKEIRNFLLLSGQLTHWATSEILLTTDAKTQAKIVKKLVLTCNWCKELHNYATITSIVEALTADKLKWAPLWSHVSGKVVKSLKDITDGTSKLFNSTASWPHGQDTASNALLSGVAFLPCLHAILVHLKMSTFGRCVTRDGCLKWIKLRKLSKILDQIRLYKQFRYTSTDSVMRELQSKLKYRIEHLTSISLDILQSHNFLSQTS